MDLRNRRTFIPFQVFAQGNQSVAYLDYVSASYLQALDDLEYEKVYRLEGQFVGYPELLAFRLYNSTDYWWILCRINEIIVPLTDMYEGMLMRIPTISSIERALTKTTAVSAVGTTVEV